MPIPLGGFHSMRILVDADACPVNHIIIDVANTFHLPVIMLTDTSHYFNYPYDHVEIITVDKGRDSVDFALVNRLIPDDIVVTGDYGVVSMALSKEAHVINHNGKLYTSDNIDFMLMNRHVSREIRKAGGKTTSIKKRTEEQNIKFQHAFINLINRLLGENPIP